MLMMLMMLRTVGRRLSKPLLNRGLQLNVIYSVLIHTQGARSSGLRRLQQEIHDPANGAPLQPAHVRACGRRET